MKHRAKCKLNKKFAQIRENERGRGRFLAKNDQGWRCFWTSKQGFRANGSILPLALRPGLGRVFESKKTRCNRIRGVALCGLFTIFGAIGVTNNLTPHSASAASITLSIPNALSLDISGASPAGTFAKSSKATVSTKTDSATGYTLSLKAKEATDENCLKNSENKIASISSNMTEEQFKSSAPVNTWGFQPDKFNSALNSNFLPGPTATESVIDKTKTANVLANNYGIVLAAKINTDLPAGTYKNTYTLSATANALTYSVHYNLNSGSGGPSPNPQTGQTDGSTFKLSDQAPTRDGFDFKGWCMTAPEEDGSCKSGVFQPGDYFVIYCDESGIELYAMWEEIPIMQDFFCYLNPGQIITLKDARDGNYYTVAKLKDNKCWMTDNLRIQNYSLTSSDSDVTTNFQIPASINKPNSNNSYTSKELHVDTIFGGYYTWYTVTAGKGTENMSSGDVSNSICPKGWRLPTIEELKSLNDALGGNTDVPGINALIGSPNNFKMGGYYYSGLANSIGSYARYWSSTAYGNVFAYVLNFASNYMYLPGSGDKVALFSARCISRI